MSCESCLTPSACPMFQVLVSKLHTLESLLAHKLFTVAWQNIATQLCTVSTRGEFRVTFGGQGSLALTSWWAIPPVEQVGLGVLPQEHICNKTFKMSSFNAISVHKIQFRKILHSKGAILTKLGLIYQLFLLRDCNFFDGLETIEILS